MKRLTPEEMGRRWTKLAKIHGTVSSHANPPNDTALGEKEEDPFDCTSIQCPPPHQAVEHLMRESFIPQWNALDDRKIVRGHRSSTAAGPERGGGWMQSPEYSLFLPPNFDISGSKTNSDENDEDDDRLIDLLDPTRTCSYREELGKLFARIPTISQIIQEQKDSCTAWPHLQAVLDEIKTGKESAAHFDAHALSRMRLSDRHAMIPVDGKPNLLTIRFEFLQRQVKRGTSSDHGRAVLEFKASQSLLDVHESLSQCIIHDTLWKDVKKQQKTADEDSGIFIVEDSLYVHGNEDYGGPIKEWLDGGDSKLNEARRCHLGIPSQGPLAVKPMKGTLLSQISLRLGIRYHYACHGNVELSLFLTDVRWTRDAGVPYPIVHDVFTHNYTNPICEGCKHLPADYVSSIECSRTDGGPRQLCERCCRELGMDPNDKTNIMDFSAWRSQMDITTIAKTPENFF